MGERGARKPVPRRRTAVVFCHPTANFLGHYALPGLAERGFGAIGLTTRYVGNDTSLILENCLLDIGAMVRHLKSSGYEQVVLVGNSAARRSFPTTRRRHSRRRSPIRPVAVPT